MDALISTAQEIAEALDEGETSNLRALADRGDEGFDVRWWESLKINPFTLLRIDRCHPGLLTGFSIEEDPSGWRVRLTALGRQVAALGTQP